MKICYIKELSNGRIVGQHVADFPIPFEAIARPLSIFDENSSFVGVQLKEPYHIGKNFIAIVDLSDEELSRL